ncbi:Crp/Fnr family transcriptional regulator [Chroococcidiopsis sp.]|uniref:Crp/Fnr family transcriptional regulator n=1 Tax=Chroococcidiopsis sp. TaxID=3088168 RepID=UPI003F39459E
MQATTEQLQQISIFSGLEPEQLAYLKPHTLVKNYLRGEIILHEGDRLPAKLFSVLSGTIQVKKTASTGKETILRTLSAGELFAAPSLFGNGISPATVVSDRDCQILTVDRTVLLEMIRQTPEIALRILVMMNDRLQHLHSTVHGLASERAIVRLARLIHTSVEEEGTESTTAGLCLRSRLPYYQIARSIGITYEECVRLFKQLQPIVSYHRGGQIVLRDRHKLEEIAAGN